MKFTLLVLCIIWGSNCTQRTQSYPLFMQEAVKCMDVHPDRSLELLNNQEDSLPYLSEENRMYYHLLCIQAKDKQYIEHTSDSLINQIVQYYENRNDADKLMMAYYYQGSTYRDMNDAPRALKAFQQAVDVSKQDNILLPKAYNQMGSLFMYQGLYDEAIRVNRKNIELYTKLGQPNKAAYALRDIARMYNMKEASDSALHYYNRACEAALADKDSARYYSIISEKGGFLYELGLMDSAKYILNLVIQQPSIKSKTHIYNILGYLYEDLQLWDSVYYYREKVITSEDLRKKFNNYKSLSSIEKQKGNYNQALTFMEEALHLNDSINRITQTEAIAKINSLYNYQHTEAENSQLKLNAERQKNWILTLSLFSLLAISVCVYLILYHKQKRVKILLEQKRKEQIEQDKYNNSLAAIRDNEIKIAELDKLLNKATTENDFLKQELLQVQKRKLEAKNEEIIQYKKEQELLLADFKRTALYREIWIASNSEDVNLSFYRHPEKWVAIQEHIDVIYPLFTERIKQIHPSLSDTELQVCWLTKLGISPSGIARVMNLSKQAITNIRSRLTKKMKIRELDFANFDLFIEDM